MDGIEKRNLTVRLSRLTPAQTSSHLHVGSPGRPRPRTIDLSRISHAHRPQPQAGRKLKPKGSGSGSAHVKIKLNFFKKRNLERTNTNKDEVEAKVTEPQVKIPSEPKTSEPSSSDKEAETPTEDKDDSSWTDELEPYQYRPLRAAAVAALEAVQGKRNGDSESSRLRLRRQVAPKGPAPKGRSRRTPWKRAAAQRAQQSRELLQRPRVTTSKSIFHEGAYFQRGDIVSVIGDEDGETYYCQVDGFVSDQMSKNHAALSWLVPKPDRPIFPFSPENYSLLEDYKIPTLVDVDDLEFLMHCPHDYFTDHQLNYMKWNPEGGTVYQRLGDPLTVTEIVPNAPTPGPSSLSGDSSSQSQR